MKISKKTMAVLLTASISATAVIGGTIAYLQDSSETIKNEFKKNTVDVTLAETTSGYDIVPGTEQAKDPKVSGNATLPSYVFVKVDDETNGLVTYSIDSGWTALPNAEGVYYREVPKGDFGPFSVLTGDKVSYSEELTNSDMERAGDDVNLTFTSYAIQKSPFNDPAAAWSEIAEEGQDTELPSASLAALDPAQIGEVTDHDESWTGNLDTAVNFATSDTVADIEDKEYKNWKVDFLLSFNKDIPDGSVVHLFGNYGTYGWLGDDLKAGGKESLAANEELKVMSDWFLPAVGMGDGQITYNDVVTAIQSFDCGVTVTDAELKDGLVATLKLVMTDGEGATHVIDSSTYNF